MIPSQDNKWEFCSRDYAQAGSIVVGSSGGATGFPVENAIDGDSQSYFKHTASLPAIVMIDLGVSRSIDRVAIKTAPFCTVGAVELSAGASEGSLSVLSVSRLGTKGEFVLRLSERVSARIVRVRFTSFDGSEPTMLKIVGVSVFAQHFVCDGYEFSLSNAMPSNPQSRSGNRNGKVLIPLLHGANYRLQSWGGLRRRMTVSFQMVRRRFIELLEFYEGRGVAFGLCTHEFQFHNVVVVPEGLRVNELPSDGAANGETWYGVDMDVQEISDFTEGLDDEPPVDEGVFAGDVIDGGGYVGSVTDVVDSGVYSVPFESTVDGGTY